MRSGGAGELVVFDALTYRENENPEETGTRIKAHPLSVLARSASISFAGDDEVGEDGEDGAVHGHGDGHLVQRDAVEEDVPTVCNFFP